MSLVSTKNTFAAIDMIKKQLQKVIFVLSLIIDAVFIGYYVFLVFLNVDKPLYIVLYSILLFVSLALLLTEILLRNKEEDDSEAKQTKKAKKKKVTKITKVIKYLAKFTILILAVVEIANGTSSPWSIVLTVLSGLLLLVLLLADLLLFFLTKAIHAIKLAIKEDLEASAALKAAHPLKSLGKKLMHIADEQEGIPEYNEDEQQVIDAIHTQAEENQEKEKAEVHHNLINGFTRIAHNLQKQREERQKEKALKEKPTVREIKGKDNSSEEEIVSQIEDSK